MLDSNNIRDKQAICYINTLSVDGIAFFKEIKASSLTRSKANFYKHRLIIKK